MASKMGKEDDLHIHSSHNGALPPSFLSFLSPARARFSKENRFSSQNAEPYLSRRAAANARIFSENASVSDGVPGGRFQKFILFPQWFQWEWTLVVISIKSRYIYVKIKIRWRIL